MTEKEMFLYDKCDHYDYLIAVCCGMVSGVVDVFFVGDPQNSVLEKWSDKMTDNIIMRLVKSIRNGDSWEEKGGITAAIDWLEKNYAVNYDQENSKLLPGMWAGNHHIKSLAHSPDIIGLTFSILNQFTNKSSFISEGNIITIDTENYELHGSTFLAKLFSGIVNWFMHLMSDIAGSAPTRRKGNRGSGIGIPFYELFLLCDFGEINTKSGKITIAKTMEKVFTKDYDARFGAAMAIPVVLNELMIKVIWTIKARYYHQREWKDCVPTKMHGDLRCMLIVGNGALCLIDITDAAIRSKGDPIAFILRLNLIAWYRLVMMVLKEISIRLGISNEQMQLSLIRINDALDKHLEDLKKYDVIAFERERDEINNLNQKLLLADTDQAVIDILYKEVDNKGINLPFSNHEEFDNFMKEDGTKLIL